MIVESECLKPRSHHPRFDTAFEVSAVFRLLLVFLASPSLSRRALKARVAKKLRRKLFMCYPHTRAAFKQEAVTYPGLPHLYSSGSFPKIRGLPEQ